VVGSDGGSTIGCSGFEDIGVGAGVEIENIDVAS
jgi:hypothetical protein